MKGVLKMGRNQKRMTVAMVSMSLLLCAGCQPFNQSLSTIQTGEDETNNMKLLQPISIETVETKQEVQQQPMTRQAVEAVVKLKVGLVNDTHQDLNRELLQKTSERLNGEYPEIEFEVETPQENNANSYLNTVNQLIAKGSQVILIPNQTYEKELETIINNYPDIVFLTFDYYTKSSNVFGIKFREESAAFLAGVIAALQTDTNKIAYLGYLEDPSVEENYVSGFRAGVKAVRSDIEVTEKYISKSISTSGLKEIVKNLYDDAHDVIFEGVGSHQHDVIEVAKQYTQTQHPVWVINSVLDLLEEGRLSNGNSVVLTSVLKNIDIVIANILNGWLTQEFTLGNQLILGLENEGVMVTLENGQLEASTLDIVNDYKEKIISGEIVVSTELAQ